MNNVADNKVLNIYTFIGVRPIIAFGNSNGDMSMLRWVDEGETPGLAGLIHHTDKGREWRYDKDGDVGHMDKVLGYGIKHHWLIVDMKKDWSRIY